jgi:cytochrome oxidase Cu insertion factor (SCO1/SenC/PrrC family)
MNLSKVSFLLLGLSVISLGVVLGTLLWLKLAPTVVYRNGSAGPSEGLAQYGLVPKFSLTERSRRTISTADLRGKIWIADFIYTTCTDTCPLQAAEMAKLQEQWINERDLKFVSFSVDPERDTPEVLSDYAKRFKADANSWLFLTGSKEHIAGLVQEGFRLAAMPVPSGGSDTGVILHSPRFVLVDRETTIRGYYDSRDAQALQRLNRDIASLLQK